MAQRYVITGGPGVGKSSVLEELADRGYHTIPEVPREIIEEQLARDGDLVPWERFYDFQLEVTKRQIGYEAFIPDDAPATYLDRGLGDPKGYCAWQQMEEPGLLQEALAHTQYDGVFLLEPLPALLNDDVRREDADEAMDIHRAVEQAYQTLGYDVATVPVFYDGSDPASISKNIQERVDMIEELSGKQALASV